MKIQVEPIFEEGEVVGRNRKIEGWRASSPSFSKDFGFRSSAIAEASLVASWHDGPVTITVVR